MARGIMPTFKEDGLMKIMGRVILIAIVFLLVFGLSRSRAQLFMLGNPLEGKTAPNFLLPTLTKEAVNLSEYREGQAAILFFWATWCPHCRTALEDLNARAQEIQSQGIKIILVDVGEQKDQVKDYSEQRRITLDVFLDEDSSVASDYSVVGVPTFFLIDKEGVVKSIKHALPQDYQELLTQAK
jgi:peroxiredoxin